MTRALLVYSHLDDAEIFGWPIFCDGRIERSVLICSSDRTNPSRQQYARGEEAFAESCSIVGITDCRVLPFWSEFYRLPSRGKDGPLLKDWWEAAEKAIDELAGDRSFDFVATHNPWGEYHHCDHLLVRRMVKHRCPSYFMRWTNAQNQTSVWPPCDTPCELIPVSIPRIGSVTADTALLDRLKQCYTSRGAWTWSQPFQESMDIYEEPI